MILTGRNSVRYNLSDTPFAQGGEGAVYEIIGMPDRVAKIYHKTVDRERIEKLKAMTALNINPYIEGVARLSWPLDILYENGTVKGCVMPKINDRLKLVNVQREKDSMKGRAYPDFNWKYSIQIAYNFALMVDYMHRQDIVIGDFNTNNFVIDSNHGGAVVFLDCDSFDFTYNGKHYNCKVAYDEVLAPELQNARLLSSASFTKESDCFSLAVHIFRLLMNNQDPFGSVDVGKIKNSSVGQCYNQRIIKGECLYVRTILGKDLPPKSLPFSFLPPDIRELFKRVFDYNEISARRKIKSRPTADEWARTLYKYAEAGNVGTELKICSKNRQHVYPYHHKECPWCRLEKTVIAPPKPKPVPPRPKPVPPKPNPTQPATQKPGQQSKYWPPYGTRQQSGTKGTTSQTKQTYLERAPIFLYMAWLLTGGVGAYMFAAPIKTLVGSLWGLDTIRVLLLIVSILYGLKMASGSAQKFRKCKNPLRYYVMALLNLVIPQLAFAAIHFLYSLVT